MNVHEGPFQINLWRLALAAALCACMACTGAQTPRQVPSPLTPQGDVLQLLAVEGDSLLLVTPRSDHRVLATSPLLEDVSALAFDARSKTAYAIARASTAPHLLRINPQVGEVKEIGPIDLPPVITRTADAVVFDPASGLLYLAVGNKGISNHFITVDPQTGATTRLGRIRDTPQGEFDGLALVRGVLYAIDHVSDETFLFTVNPEGPQVTAPLGKLPGKITDLAGDPGSGRLFAAVDGHLATLRVSGGLSSAVHPRAPALTAVTVIASGPELFVDDFESGDLSAWSDTRNH